MRIPLANWFSVSVSAATRYKRFQPIFASSNILKARDNTRSYTHTHIHRHARGSTHPAYSVDLVCGAFRARCARVCLLSAAHGHRLCVTHYDSKSENPSVKCRSNETQQQQQIWNITPKEQTLRRACWPGFLRRWCMTRTNHIYSRGDFYFCASVARYRLACVCVCVCDSIQKTDVMTDEQAKTKQIMRTVNI